MYNAAKNLENLIKRVNKLNIAANKQEILDFINDLKAKNKAANTIIKYVYPLYQMNKFEWINKDFKDLQKDDLKEVIVKVNENAWAAMTKKNFRLAIKVFYKWLEGIDEPRFYPERVRWIVTNIPKRDQKELTFDDMVTRDEIKKMADAAFNPMHKAFAWLCYESTGRPEECLNLKYSDCKFDDRGAIILLHGSKDKRPARLVTAAEYLHDWLEMHPLKDQKDYPIWVTQFSKHKIDGQKWTQLEGNGANKILKTLAARVGIDKRITLYSLRKGRLTELAKSKQISSSLFKSIVGWTQNTHVADRYLKFSHEDLDQAILAADAENDDRRQKAQKALNRIKIKDKELFDALVEYMNKEMGL